MAAYLLTLSWITCLLAMGSSLILSGKYRRLFDCDYFFLKVGPSGYSVEISYHNHTLRSSHSTMHDDILKNFQIHRVVHLFDNHTYHRQIITSSFTSLNDSYLSELQHHQEYLWKLIDEKETKNSILEIALIHSQQTSDETFIHHAFTLPTLPFIHHWHQTHSEHSCPNNENHPLSEKTISITLTHLKIWQEFFQKYSTVDSNQRILIFQGGIRCVEDFCGDIALEQSSLTSKDVLFLGWCYKEDKPVMTNPPHCAHAYSISVKAAKVLVDRISPCMKSVGDQIFELCKQGELTWETAITKDNTHSNLGLFRLETMI